MLKVYNTLTRKLENLKPINDKKINLFVCGPTVYDFSHLGHAKTYIQFDIIVKYLRYKGYKTFYLQNITDIDDKIIKKANEENTDWKTISRRYEQTYLEDMKNLDVNSVNKYARATDHIPQIISQVKRLIKKGYAYKISDGYYFDLSKFKEYGKLAKRKSQEAEDSVSRIDENPEKKNKGDFCLWKFSKPGDPFWQSKELIKGRPGWHIEDTAITEKEFGPQYDIHGGGLDLIFPHHEAEIVQMESISGKKPLVKYWLHTGFLQIKKEKMSKSLGNFFTIRDVIKKYNKNILRFLFLQTHYRKPIDFSEEAIEQAKNSLQKLNEFILKLKNYKSRSTNNKKINSMIEKTKNDFEKSMDEDFETPKALTVLFEFMKEINKLIAEKKISTKDTKKIKNFMNKINEVFGILDEEIKVPEEIKELAEKREQARKNKDFKLADGLREKIKSLGYYIDDTKDGMVIKKL
ncbi:cysteine--tRNA ligase [Candidatus Woesearchaeota archaeon]|nr:cysteine--tRNA ligase [Candidatus Woesearchaeota archaeon]